MNQSFNPMQLMQMIKTGQNPQQLVINLLEQNMSNSPVGANLINLAKQGDSKGIEQVARNLSKQQGIDFDKEFAAFCRMLGIQ